MSGSPSRGTRRSSHGYAARDGWFIDPKGRRTLLRGVNLGGSSKVPARPDGATWQGVDFDQWADVSFVGRPFCLDEADRHLERIAHWGFNTLRLLVTWEAIEHAGPGDYDEAYLDFVRSVTTRAREHGLLVFVDPHHDVWSRFTGGDGAPYWCFEWAGLAAERFFDARAVVLDDFNWPSSYQRAPVAHMWTLFYAGDSFCPELAGVQGRLQDHYIGAIAALAERLADLDNVLGYDSLNEPSYGYIGLGEEIASRRGFGFRAHPFSMLDHLAAADGISVHSASGERLDPGGVSIWRNGCPWRRAGVWDVDAAGTPQLLAPTHFKQRGGRDVSAWSDFVVPFIGRLRERLRAVHPDCFLFIEGAPTDVVTHWDDPDPLVCNARHWYDVVTLAGRRFDPAHYEAFGQTAQGAAEIGALYAKQLGGLKQINQNVMGGLPMLIGEFGIPFEMNEGAAYRSGDYTAQLVALDANYRALEENLLHSTLWNYTADNTHAHGDNWNGEDLSIFSLDDQRDPDDIDSGGRATRAFCRPVLRAAAGQPLRMGFDLESRRFELVLEGDPACDEPTEIYVPRIHYPAGVCAEVSAGEVTHEPERQRLLWDAGGRGGELRLVLRPR